MPRGNVRVSITGDADGVSRATRDAERSLDRLNKAGSRSMAALGTAAKGGAALLGVGLVVGLKKSADAAIEAEKSHARLVAQLKASGISYKQHAGEIENVIQKTSQLSALDDEDLQDAFTNIVRVTGDVNKSLRLTGLAADFARAKHMDVAKAGEIVGKVAGGNIGILSRYGITVKDGATATEALGELQQKFAGQAEAYGKTTGGSIDRAKVAVENLEEAVGSKLAPAIQTVAGGLADFINGMQSGAGAGGQFAASVRQSASAVEKAWNTALKAVRRFLADNRQDIRQLGQAFQNIWRGIRAVFEDVVLPIFRRMLPAIVQMVRGWVQEIRGVIKVFSGLFTGDFHKMWDGIKDIFGGGVKAVLGTVRSMTAPLREVASKVAHFVGEVMGDAWRNLKDVVSDAISPIRKVLDLLRKVGGVASDLGSAAGDVKDFLNPLGDGIGLEGLPTNLGAGKVDLMGANQNLAPFALIGSRFGLGVTSGFRPGAITASGNPSLHGQHRAIDVDRGTAGQMLAYARYLATNFGSKLTELIHTPLGFGIKNGQRVPLSFWGSTINAQHFSHVHVGLQRGGRLPGSRSGDRVPALLEDGEFVVNRRAARAAGPLLEAINRGIPRFANGGAVRAAQALYKAGARGAELVGLTAVAGRETRWVARKHNYNLATGDDSWGPWQINVLQNANPQYRGLAYSGKLYDWDISARIAHQMYQRSGIAPWKVVPAEFLPTARSAVAKVLKHPASAHPVTGRAGETPGQITKRTADDARRAALRGRGLSGLLAGRGQNILTGQELSGKGVPLVDRSGADTGGGGGSEPDPALQLLADAAVEHNRLLDEQNQIARRTEAYLRTQGPQLIAGLAMLTSGVIGGNAGLGRQFPSSAGLGGLARA
jgi:hypothetical protein